MDLDHLSYFSISSYLSCGAYWRFRYVQKVQTPTASALFFGSVFHETIESYVRQSVEVTEKPATLTDLWMNKWAAKIAETENVDFGRDTPESLCNSGLSMLGNEKIQYGINTIKPGTDEQGTKIERKVELHVPGVSIPIIGYIDIITDDGVPGDFKTSSRSWTDDKAQNELQPLFYLTALNQAGIKGDGRFRHYVFVKTKEPKIQIIEHQHDLKESFFLMQMIRSVWGGIDRGVFPMNPTGWRCSPDYCEYWIICRGRYV